MLTYCRSADLQVLADHLLEELTACPLDNPLSPEIFVVQNHGMAQWLSLHMARKEGIAANLKFEFPAERMWSLIRIMDESVPKLLPSDRGPLTWGLMHLLNVHIEEKAFAPLHRYIEDEDTAMKWMRSWKLCERISDIFDQYLIYRPEFIWTWEEGSLHTDDSSERWQAALWRKLLEQWEGAEMEHRASLQKKLLQSLKEKSLNLNKLPERVIIFGVSGMPPVYLDILVCLSELVDVYFYEFAVSDIMQNDFLKSVGREGADYRHNLEQAINRYPDVQKNMRFCNIEPLTTHKNSNCLLWSVQADLNETNKESASKITEDHSIQVHSCHSPMREVEVLYDQILALLDEDQSLSPADILVMTPDMETYAPVVDAVFGTGEAALPNVPYSITDRRSSPGSLTLSFLKLLQIMESRFKVTDVVDLIGMEPLRKSFDLTDEDLNTIERWIKENRIRWGKDGAQKKSMGLPADPSFTWQAGLDRVMLGYAMKPVSDQLFRKIYPYKEIEGTDEAALAGSLYQLMNLLFDFQQKAGEMQSPEGWSHILKEMLKRFFTEEGEYLHEWAAIHRQLEQLIEHGALAGFKDKIPFNIIRTHLSDQLMSSSSSGGGHMGRGVTFSSLIPMRSIPFKVIGMIGMNDGSFPHARPSVEFDLLQKFPEPGDRNHRNDERYIFLQNILSAGKVLYISYQGQSNREDMEYPPSVVLREFFDYLEKKFMIPPAELITKHPLQPFSRRYFKPEKGTRLFTFSPQWREVASGLNSAQQPHPGFFHGETLPAPEEEWKKLSLRELIRFYQHPARYLIQNRLGMHLNDEEIITEDREPFRLHGLEGYQLGQELLGRYLEGKDVESFKPVADSLDLLPEGWPGEQAYRNKAGEVRRFGRFLSKRIEQEKLAPLEIHLNLEPFFLTGRMDNIYADAKIEYRFGRMRPKDMINLWISHLAYSLSKPDDYPVKSLLLARDSKDPVAFYQLDRVKAPQEILRGLLQKYWQGLQGPVPFFPETSFAYAEEVCLKNKNESKGLKKASYQWRDEFSAYPKEGDDLYNKRVYGHTDPVESRLFIDSAVEFWGPFFEALNQGSN